RSIKCPDAVEADPPAAVGVFSSFWRYFDRQIVPHDWISRALEIPKDLGIALVAHHGGDEVDKVRMLSNLCQVRVARAPAIVDVILDVHHVGGAGVIAGRPIAAGGRVVGAHPHPRDSPFHAPRVRFLSMRCPTRTRRLSIAAMVSLLAAVAVGTVEVRSFWNYDAWHGGKGQDFVLDEGCASFCSRSAKPTPFYRRGREHGTMQPDSSSISQGIWGFEF